MSDLLPLLAFCGGVLVTGAGAFLVRRDAPIVRPTRARIGVVLGGIAMIALPYLAYRIVAGDPDVWDFYRSAWFVLLVVQGALAAYLALASLMARRGGRPQPA